MHRSCRLISDAQEYECCRHACPAVEAEIFTAKCGLIILVELVGIPQKAAQQISPQLSLQACTLSCAGCQYARTWQAQLACHRV